MLNFFDFRLIKSYFSGYVKLARWHKPTGALLLYLPCCWGLVLASASTHSTFLYAKFLIGSFLMRGAGCTINDIFDRQLDRKVERTQARPLASGAISVVAALIFLCIQLILGLCLLLSFGHTTIWLAVSIMPFVIIYPLTKRVTYFPQLFLGIVFNWGVLIAYLEVTGTLTLSAFLVYLIGILWTLLYDTIYAYQDMEDDRLAGIKSMTLIICDYQKIFFLAFLAMITILWVQLGNLKEAGLFYYTAVLILLGIIGSHLISLNTKDKNSCAHFFNQCIWYGVGFYFLCLWS